MAVQIGMPESHKAEPNVVPMIDIMLVLLIIFMIVTPMIASGFRATMPMGKNLESRPEEAGDIVLGIDQMGDFFLDPGSGEIRKVADGQLEGILVMLYENRIRDKILYFKADRNLRYGAIEDAMELARRAGVRVMAAVTEETREGTFFGRRKRERERGGG